MSVTKRLARELGALRRGTTLLNAQAQKSAKTKTTPEDQIYSHLIVLDFEATCWSCKTADRKNEIIEFPAVLLNTKSGKVESEFQSFVRPTENPKLSTFCKQFTGISQEQVDAAEPLESSLRMFDKWIKDLVAAKEFVFACESAELWRNLYPNLCTFLTWSDWDLGRCLPDECKRKRLQYPSYLKHWIDLRATYKNFYNQNPRGVGGSLEDLGISFKGREHSGIDDARNTAHLAQHMINDGCILKNTKSTDKAYFNFQPELTVEVKWKNIKSGDGENSDHCAKQIGALLRNGKTSQHLTSSVKQTDKKDKTRELIATSTDEVPRSSSNLSTEPKAPGNQEMQSDMFDDSVLEEHMCKMSGNASLNDQVERYQNPLNTFQMPVSLVQWTPDNKQKKTNSTNGKLKCVSVVKKQTFSPPLSQSGNKRRKITTTPPFCKCGRRATRKVVQKQGPTKGRSFFSCGDTRSTRDSGCTYFEWERLLSFREQREMSG